MKNIYAAFVLWLIGPALDRSIALQKTIAGSITGSVIAPDWGSSIGDDIVSRLTSAG